ncbi:MAG: hypothetical protein ACLQJR_10955, partial [Stellaceae bacterium]
MVVHDEIRHANLCPPASLSSLSALRLSPGGMAGESNLGVANHAPCHEQAEIRLLDLNIRAVLALNHNNVVLALQIKPELVARSHGRNSKENCPADPWIRSRAGTGA